jgi:glyoxylase-like metal-dependent hydrolase (beta-lactamase superfamily II)
MTDVSSADARPELSDWTVGEAFEVTAGVYRIPLPLPNDGLRAVNVYAVVDGNDLVMIDGGLSIPLARNRLARALDGIGFSFGDIRRFLVTHVHRDHYTQAIDIRRDFGTVVGLGAGERRALELHAEGHGPLDTQMEQLRACGADELISKLMALVDPDAPRSPDWELPDSWLTAGELVLESGWILDVIETPGHTRGHVVFHDKAAQLLFAGDHVLPTITPSIGFEPVLSQNPLGDYLGSLARVRALPDAQLLPAHGPVMASVHTRIDELVAHHGSRLDETEAAVAAGADTAYQVAGQLRWTKKGRRLADLDLFNQMLAIIETGAHLALLSAQGRLTELTGDDAAQHFSSSR